MIRVGAVNIDTSHPAGFAEAMKKDGRLKYVGVYDDSFRDEAQIGGFIAGYGLEKRCQSLEELAEMCDIGFIHGCNWEDHLRCIMPFAELGKPVFVDKPLVGSKADCDRVRRLAQEGAVILGASSARYAREIQSFLALPAGERGNILQVYGTAGVDEFNYGIHIVEAVGGIMGRGAETVKYMGRGVQGGKYCESFFVGFKDGRCAVYTTMSDTWQRFALQILTDKTTCQLLIEPAATYEALIGQIADHMEGGPSLLADTETLLESVEIMLAGAASRAKRGEAVRLDEIPRDTAFDGKKFLEAYRAKAVPMYIPVG